MTFMKAAGKQQQTTTEFWVHVYTTLSQLLNLLHQLHHQLHHQLLLLRMVFQQQLLEEWKVELLWYYWLLLPSYWFWFGGRSDQIVSITTVWVPYSHWLHVQFWSSMHSCSVYVNHTSKSTDLVTASSTFLKIISPHPLHLDPCGHTIIHVWV